MSASATVPPLEITAKGLVTRLPEGKFAGAQKGLLAVGVVALGASLLGVNDPHFLPAYLVAYLFSLTICLGALMLVMIQHITRAGWSTVVRRVLENMASVLPIMALLFVPIAWNADQLFHHWWKYDPADTVLAGKSGYLSHTFWYVRAAVYFAIWIGLATWFRRTSLAQDQSGDPALSLRMARRAAPGLLLGGLTITFAAFDWIMSLNPHWFSTMFGVIFYAGSVMAAWGTLALLCMALRKGGYLKDAINAEHYHDMGKLLFAFMVFWSYTSFSQYMLIWYANLPEETEYFQMRLQGGWEPVGQALIVGHFLLPFAFLMSRHTKRNTVPLAIAAIWLLAMHWLDLHFMVLPNLHPDGPQAGFHPSWLDATTLIGMAAIFASFTLGNVRKVPLVPERDPRLAESLHFQNI